MNWLIFVKAVLSAVFTNFVKLLNRVKTVAMTIGVTIIGTVIGTVIANLLTEIIIHNYFVPIVV